MGGCDALQRVEATDQVGLERNVKLLVRWVVINDLGCAGVERADQCAQLVQHVARQAAEPQRLALDPVKEDQQVPIKVDAERLVQGLYRAGDGRQDLLGVERVGQGQVKVNVSRIGVCLARVVVELDKIARAFGTVGGITVGHPCLFQKGQALDLQAVFPVKDLDEGGLVYGWVCVLHIWSSGGGFSRRMSSIRDKRANRVP